MENVLILKKSVLYTTDEIYEAMGKSELRQIQKNGLKLSIDLLMENYHTNGLVDVRLLCQAANEEGISVILKENKEYSKKDLAHIFTNNNAFSDRYSEDDIPDEVLAQFNQGMAKLSEAYPELDPMYSEDYLGEADDKFYDLLIDVSKKNGMNLFPSEDEDETSEDEDETSEDEDEAPKNDGNKGKPENYWQDSQSIPEDLFTPGDKVKVRNTKNGSINKGVVTKSSTKPFYSKRMDAYLITLGESKNPTYIHRKNILSESKIDVSSQDVIDNFNGLKGYKNIDGSIDNVKATLSKMSAIYGKPVDEIRKILSVAGVSLNESKSCEEGHEAKKTSATGVRERRIFEDSGAKIGFTKSDYDKLLNDKENDYPFYSSKNGDSMIIFDSATDNEVAEWNSKTNKLSIGKNSDKLPKWLKKYSYGLNESIEDDSHLFNFVPNENKKLNDFFNVSNVEGIGLSPALHKGYIVARKSDSNVTDGEMEMHFVEDQDNAIFKDAKAWREYPTGILHINEDEDENSKVMHTANVPGGMDERKNKIRNQKKINEDATLSNDTKTIEYVWVMKGGTSKVDCQDAFDMTANGKPISYKFGAFENEGKDGDSALSITITGKEKDLYNFIFGIAGVENEDEFKEVYLSESRANSKITKRGNSKINENDDKKHTIQYYGRILTMDDTTYAEFSQYFKDGAELQKAKQGMFTLTLQNKAKEIIPKLVKATKEEEEQFFNNLSESVAKGNTALSIDQLKINLEKYLQEMKDDDENADYWDEYLNAVDDLDSVEHIKEFIEEMDSDAADEIFAEINEPVNEDKKITSAKKPTKKDYPYDAATGWQNWNNAKMEYYNQTGKKTGKQNNAIKIKEDYDKSLQFNKPGYTSFTDKDGDTIYNIPYDAKTIEELVDVANEDEDLMDFLWSQLGSSEGVKTKDGNIFYCSDIGDQLRYDKNKKKSGTIAVPESIATNKVPDFSITGEYEGEPQVFSGEDLKDLLDDCARVAVKVDDFIRKVAYGITDQTSDLSKEDENHLKQWYGEWKALNEKRKLNESITNAAPSKNKMHQVLGIPDGDKIIDHYSSGSALAKALASKIGKAGASRMLNYAANINKDSNPIFRSAAEAIKSIKESVDCQNIAMSVRRYALRNKMPLTGDTIDTIINKIDGPPLTSSDLTTIKHTLIGENKKRRYKINESAIPLTEEEYAAISNEAIKTYRSIISKAYLTKDDYTSSTMKDIITRLAKEHGCTYDDYMEAVEKFQPDDYWDDDIKNTICPSCDRELSSDQMGILRCYNKGCEDYGISANVKQPIDEEQTVPDNKLVPNYFCIKDWKYKDKGTVTVEKYDKVCYDKKDGSFTITDGKSKGAVAKINDDEFKEHFEAMEPIPENKRRKINQRINEESEATNNNDSEYPGKIATYKGKTVTVISDEGNTLDKSLLTIKFDDGTTKTKVPKTELVDLRKPKKYMGGNFAEHSKQKAAKIIDRQNEGKGKKPDHKINEDAVSDDPDYKNAETIIYAEFVNDASVDFEDVTEEDIQELAMLLYEKGIVDLEGTSGDADIDNYLNNLIEKYSSETNESRKLSQPSSSKDKSIKAPNDLDYSGTNESRKLQPNRRNINESTSDTRVVVMEAYVSSTEDNYQKGEIGKTFEYPLKPNIHCTVTELINKLSSLYGIPSSKDNWKVNTGSEKSNLICQFTGDSDNVEASKSEIEKFKNGDISLFSVEFAFEVLPIGEPMAADELASLLGVEKDEIRNN